MRAPVSLLGCLFLCVVAAKAQDKVDYHADVKFAIEAIDLQCKTLLAAKKIEWKKVTAPLLAESKKTKRDDAHLHLLWRLLARLQDGHAEVRKLERGRDVRLYDLDRSFGPGMFLCRIDKAVFVKNVWGPAEAAGLQPGMEVTKIASQPPLEWLAARREQLVERIPFSTLQQAEFFTCHQGLMDVKGATLRVEVKGVSGRNKFPIEFEKCNQTPNGPAFPPASLRTVKDVSWGTSEMGNGYVHVRRCPEDLPSQIDEALAALGDVPGMILDFRGNSGGGFDHEALFGRFLPKGVQWQVGSGYASAGERPYGGPLVVIVDATVRSAGETAAGMFGEDGRGYLIGESPTAGMSSQKTTIELPSKLFALYVSVASNKARFQGGKGIEGIGVIPHEIVPFAAADLAARRDTQIARADALLADFPQAKVRYDPSEHGWTAPKGK